MRWDDPIFEGTHGHWRWIISVHSIPSLTQLVLSHHVGRRLVIVAFDGGAIRASDQEIAAGWLVVGKTMASPPISADLNVPRDQHDEWYIFEDASRKELKVERFVNYGGLNLAEPRELAASFDSSWERSGLDWLYPIQERFWQQVESVNPISYIAAGDNTVVVTQQQPFASSIRRELNLA